MNLTREFDKPFEVCPLCNSDSIRPYKIDYIGINIYKCDSCKIEFMNPQYTEGYLNDYYSSYLDLDKASEDVAWGKALMTGHDFYLKLIEKYVNNGTRKLLSIGSGEGWELRQAQKRGWEVEGFDVDVENTNKLSVELNIPVKNGDFLEIPYEKNSFDAIYMHHVLEHPKTPGRYLEKIHGMLKKDGILFIACPNIDSLANRFKSTLDRFDLKKRKAKHYDTFHHLFYYNPYKLKKLLEKHYGFKVRKIRNGYHVRPNQSGFYRFLLKNFLEVIPHKSTFMLIAQKVGS